MIKDKQVKLKYTRTSWGRKEVYENTLFTYNGRRERREIIKWAIDRLAQYRGKTRPDEIKVVMYVNGKLYKTYNRDKVVERIAKRVARRK